jgi:hypothetical protein
MSFAHIKGRFTVNNLSEGDNVDIILEVTQKFRTETDEDSYKSNLDLLAPQNTSYRSVSFGKIDKNPGADLSIHEKSPENEIYEISALKNSCIKVFQDQMNAKYIEMINFHKEQMLNYIKKDTERQQKIMKLLDEIAHFTKANLCIEQENLKLNKIIIENGKL